MESSILISRNWTFLVLRLIVLNFLSYDWMGWAVGSRNSSGEVREQVESFLGDTKASHHSVSCANKRAGFGFEVE
jgi:hypothetical protein